MKIGDRVRIIEDPEQNTYIIAGEHFNRFWLSVEQEDYDGYNGELIIGHIGESIILPQGEWFIQTADERCKLPWEINLTLIDEN